MPLILDSGTTTLIISNEEMDIMKVVNSLEDSRLLLLAKQCKMRQKSKKGDLLYVIWYIRCNFIKKYASR